MTLRVAYSPWLRVSGGCVAKAGSWTRMTVPRAGIYEVGSHYGSRLTGSCPAAARGCWSTRTRSENHLADPLGRVLTAVQSERRESLVAVSAHERDNPTLDASRAATDKEVAGFLTQTRAGNVTSAASSDVREGVDGAEKFPAMRFDIRHVVDSGKPQEGSVLDQYTSIDDSIAAALKAMTILPNQSAEDIGQALQKGPSRAGRRGR